MTDGSTLEKLAVNLERRLHAAYDPDSTTVAGGGQPLVEAFEAFGDEAGKLGITLEDTMSVSVDTLQRFFERHGGYGNDPSTIRVAGIALARVSNAHSRSQVPEEPELQEVAQDALPTQMARLAALHRINRTATANLKLQEMLETTVAVVAEATGSDAAAVFLFDETAGLLTLRAAVGLNPSAVGAATLRIGNGITGRAALEATTIAATDAHLHPAFLAHPGIGDEIYTSQVSVPIMIQGQNRLVGILNINSLVRREFDHDELEFLQTVAGELGISIENARQYSNTDEQLRQKVSELATLQRVSRIVASTLDLNEVIRLITEQAVELLHAEAAAIFRQAPGRKRNADAAPIVEYRIGSVRVLTQPEQRDDIVNEVLRTGNARSTDINFVDGVSRLICVPLRSARETVGALCFRLRTLDDISEDTLGVLQAFSDSAAMAIENAQLYQDAMHSIQTQSALVQEMHHRVRNNLQTVAALLSLQIRSAEDAAWATEIREAVSRIQAIAAVHDLLSDESRLAGTTVDIIARHVAEDAHSTLIPPHLKVKFDLPPSNLTVPSRQATILSLLINELTSNAIHHGFKGRKEGFIRIQSRNEDGTAIVEVFNDGQGVPEGFNPAMSSGLGMKITQRLVVSDLRGTFDIRSDESGTRATIRFPIASD